ncbi:bifunctional 4-hydroxy-3-methylbut-2-enyl diphosphate reductase/30S ribosomal protein S1 [Miniphocaeibacter halophilus]|uniref:Bifunctional 4-hydroxy-3-methylbut-2-enyl diphosphate reductase/30S ribosomal protein S1 n=1 Tax=Miniphocaeibacter halophilus TaxID=2931922 RepID=A0AC61MT12_9FIRM|nr:bifunctional 4-hydroxy-3-methylbut-2-enyl diphosphate reductase/30S ribosomal protein S1 [Miniphocaeibacter halophilus]QQK07564.1 bifunctional 4-hydroxy-3-methylbut-2-enyl diphosphate reductase/30S ribosomal protein S1 [Miniphocaeibacter halophilus]
MEIYIAKNAGFCFGVKRAIDITEKALDSTVKTNSLGLLIHNEQEVGRLKEKGLNVLDEIKETNTNENLVIRSHGETLEKKNEIIKNGYNLIDATCPILLSIYKKIQKAEDEGYTIVIIGDKNHPEIIGICGQISTDAIVINSIEEAERIKNKKNLYIISQTTNLIEKFLKLSDIIDRSNTNVVIKNTICNATKLRQQSTIELSKQVDAMIVIGGKTSSNTNKLYELSKKHCKNSFRIETVNDLSLQEVLKYKKIGITAGASTPEWIIEEVVQVMDNYSKDEFMEQVEGSITKIYPKDVVKGSVIYVTDNEVMVNIGYSSDGIIKLDELSTDPDKKPKDLFTEGQEIEVYVIKLDDGEGNVVLSTRRVEGLKNWKKLVEIYENDETVNAEVIKEVKGGLLASVLGINAFIPGSQITTSYVKDLSPYVGQTLECKIISIDEKKRRLVLSRRQIEEAAERERIDKAWENIEVDKILPGRVERLTDFGAFVDVGGIDGLIHISDISWRRIKHPSDVLTVGDEIEVKVLRANKEKNRISLGLKQLTKKPFELFMENNNVGDIVTGEVVNLLDFGAFVRLEEGVEGLVHVSQISYEHVEKPSDELNIGDKIQVKILDINPETKRIALSIKETLEKPEMPERPEPKKAKKPKEDRMPEYENQELEHNLGEILDAELNKNTEE